MATTSPAIEGAGEQIGESSVPVIQRFNVLTHYDSALTQSVRLDPQGDFVTYADHIAAITNPSGQRLTGNDAATFKLFQHLLDTIATTEQDPLFAGFRMEEMLSPDGLLLAVRLVACDAIGGIAAPRVV